MDELLANLLQNYPAIWNRQSEDFKNNLKKENSFKELAHILNTTVNMSFYIQLVSHSTMFDLFTRQELTDVKFMCTDGEIGAHSVVLKANSKWFQNNNNVSVVAVINQPKDTVQNFLTLLYQGSGHFDNNSKLRTLLTGFQCTYQVNEINGISDEGRCDTLIQTPVKIDEHPVEIEEHKVEIQEHPVEIQEHSVKIQEHPVEIEEHPVEIEEHPVEIQQHPVEIQEHSVEIDEHPVEIEEHPVEIQEHPVEIQEHPVEIQEPSVEIDEHPVEIEEHPVEIQEHLVDMKEHPVEVQEHPVEIQEHPVEIEVSPSASDSPSNRLLPNPYALNNSGLHKKKSRSIRKETSSSPVLLAAKDIKTNDPTNNSPQKDKTNSQLSDNSDVCIVEIPPSFIEIHDTLTQDVVPPPRAKVEEDLDDTPDNLESEHSSQKRKADQTVDSVRADVTTSDETDFETPSPESLAKKKKSDTRTAQGRKDQEDEDSDESEISLPRRRVVQKTKDAQKQHRNLIGFSSTDDEEEPNTQNKKQNTQSNDSKINLLRRRVIQKTKDAQKQQRNLIGFSSTDDEEEPNTQSKKQNTQRNDQNVGVKELQASSSKNIDLKTEVMEFQNVHDMLKKKANFCFVCEDYTPLLKTHYAEHQWSRWGQKETCPNCKKKFGKKTMLKVHLGECKGEKSE